MSSKDVIDDSVAWLCLMVAVLYATVILRRPEHVPRSSSQQREARNTYNNTSSIGTVVWFCAVRVRAALPRQRVKDVRLLLLFHATEEEERRM